MAELCRVANAAVRSTSLLRSTPKWSSPCSISMIRASPALGMLSMRQISTTPILQSINSGSETRGTSSTNSFWSKPAREGPKLEEDIKKPDISAYDDPFVSDIDFEIGELDKFKANEDRPAPTRPPIRLVPRTGRTVHVGKNVDVARSFRLLNMQVAQNQIRRDFQSQRYHERAGLKRKRLRSERWQKRFKKGFKACVSRVKELTKQGW